VAGPPSPLPPGCRAALGLAAGVLLLPATGRSEGLLVSVDGGVVATSAPPEFSEFWRTGWGVGGGVSVVLSPLWEVATSVHYQRFPADEGAQVDDLLLAGPGGIRAIASLEGRDAQVVALTGEVRFLPPMGDSALGPYLAFGAGFFRLSTTEATVVAATPDIPPVVLSGDTDSALAATVGVGARLRVSERLRLGAESIYTIGFTEPSSTEYLPLRVLLAAEL
jgi:opacity protein-like surface antigen